MKEKADPANMVACNARPGPIILSFLIYRLQIRIPAGTVAAIIATIAAMSANHPGLGADPESRGAKHTETMNHYTMHQADEVSICGDGRGPKCQLFIDVVTE